MFEALFSLLGGGLGSSLGSLMPGGSMPGGATGTDGSMPFGFGGKGAKSAADGALADASAMTAQGQKAHQMPTAQVRPVDLSQLMAALQKRNQLGTGGM